MKKLILPLIIFLLSSSALIAKNKEEPSAQEIYNNAITAFQKKEWSGVTTEAKRLFKLSEESPFLGELYFLSGVAYFHLGDYDISNEYFSTFLEKYASPKYFEEAIIYKYQIAEKFEEGYRKHAFGMRKMPKLVSGWDDAYEIYNEVINTLPRHDVSAKALYHKGLMLVYEGRYKEGVESFQTLIRRFPKHTLTPESYIAIGKAYLEESKAFSADRDFLEQARFNLKKFHYDFPQESRVVECEAMLVEMLDRYARDLWDSAMYFDKKNKKKSALLYFQTILKKYPESKYAMAAADKLELWKDDYPEVVKGLDAFFKESDNQEISN